MLIWGHGIDDSLGSKVRITVIATGLHNNTGMFGKKTTSIEQKEQNISSFRIEDTNKEENIYRENETKIVESLFTTNLPDNNQLRGKSEDEVTEYLNVPAYYREQKLKDFDNNEMSNYKAGSNGLECSAPTFLRNAVD
jgi:hypothetical protein